MSDIVLLLRANPGLAIVTALLLLSTVVLAMIALIMGRANASLRPIVFLGGFMAIVIAPQFAFHLAQAKGWIPRRSLTWVPAGASTPRYALDTTRTLVRDGRFADRRALFGDDHDPALVVDLRERMANGPLAGALSGALAAEMAALRSGASLTVARFASPAEAERAAGEFATRMLGARPPVGTDGARTVARANDVAKLLVAGDGLLLWSAADSATVERLFASSPLVARDRSPAPQGTDGDARDYWLYRPYTLVPLMLLLVAVAVLWFFRAASWASETPAHPNVAPVDADALRQRLLAVNALDVPFRVDASAEDPSTIVVSWRYADARWVDLQRARGVRRTHRILMRLDEREHTVRPTEQVSLIDWSVGYGGASVRWVTQRGIVFFQRERERLFGVQFTPEGRPTANLSYAYTFDLQEMKAPFVQAVTAAGWRWRPTLVHAPRWLSWRIPLAMGLLASLLTACGRTSGAWARQPLQVHTLDGGVRVEIPAALTIDERVTEHTPDWHAYQFRKRYKSHLNGQTSWAEILGIAIVAPDLPRERFDALLANGAPRLQELGWGRRPGAGVADDQGLRWLVQEQMYDRDPVHEPSWSIRVDDRAAGIVIGWRGFKKHYTLDDAKANLRALHASVRVRGDLQQSFAAGRSWSGSEWQRAYAENLEAVRAVMRERAFPLAAAGTIARQGAWRIAIDDERPQQLHVAHAIAALTLPDGPFTITEPVTYFQNWSGNWRQDNQGGKGSRLPESLFDAMRAEHTDPAKVYFYRIRSFDLWRRYPPGEFARTLRAALRDTEAEVARWTRDGFIGSDAEP